MIITSIQKLQKLNEADGVKVSMYVPSHPKTDSANHKQDRIRLKNAIQDVRHKLGGQQVLKKELKQLESKFMSDDFIKHQSLSVAAFISQNTITILRLPIETEYAARVSDSFVLEPLYLIQNLMLEAYIIDANKHQPRVFFGGLEFIEEVELDVLAFDELLELDHEQVQQYHSSKAGTSSAMYHGHGARTDNSVSDFEYYMSYVTKKIRNTIGATRHLVLLAGDARTTQMMYSMLQLPNSVMLPSGNIEHLNQSQVHDVLKKELKAHTRISVDDLRGNSSVIKNMKDAYQLIAEGRAGRVFVPALRDTTDSVRAGIDKHFILSIPESPKMLAAIREAVTHGSNVFAVSQSDLKGIAVTARY